jgi:RNA polymerase sigma-70 factor (ECF subfamily)
MGWTVPMSRRLPKDELDVGKAARLMGLARHGSRSAIGQLLEAYRPCLLSIAAAEFDSDLKAKAGPSDLVQETFIDAQRDFASFKSDSVTELRIWLHAILMNNLADLRKRYLRAKKRQVCRERPLTASGSKELVKALVAPDGHSPSRIAISKEEHARIEAGLNRLPAAYRQVIIMRSQQRQSIAKIAQTINRSPDAVRMLWNRAVLRLKHELEDGDGRK